MPLKLYLYRDITPNINVFLFFNSYTTLKTYLSTKLDKTLNIDNYRFNNNSIQVKSFNVNDNITYAIEEETDENNNILRWRAYHVISSIFQSGYYIFETKIDLWNTYFLKASISDIVVNRCNRLIDIPVFDNIRGTTGQESNLSVDSNNEYNGIATADYLNVYRNINKYYLVMIINFNAKQSITGDNQASTTSVFAINLRDIRLKYIEGIDPQQTLTDEEERLYYDLSAVEMARDFAGGIFSIDSTGFAKNDAKLINAYILDQAFINNSGWETSFESVSLLTRRTLSLNALILETSDVEKPLYIRSLNLNKEIYVGRCHGGLKLNRIINENYAIVYIRTIIGASSIEVDISQGDNQEDITPNFELVITNNVSQDTPLRSIAKAIGRTGKTTSDIKKGYEKGGALGAIGSSMENLASLVGDFSLQREIRGSGDALNAYKGYQDYVLIPYKATAFSSIDDEEANARINGATFSTRIASITSLFDTPSYTLLGSNVLSETYLRATCKINRIPSEAIEYFTRLFASGLYLKDIRQ